MDGLAKPKCSEGFGGDTVLGFNGVPTEVGDEKKRQGGVFSMHLTVSKANLVRFAL